MDEEWRVEEYLWGFSWVRVARAYARAVRQNPCLRAEQLFCELVPLTCGEVALMVLQKKQQSRSKRDERYRDGVSRNFSLGT